MKITPFLWFDTQAEEAANYYTGIFKNSRITDISRFPDEGRQFHGKPPGFVMVATFELDGQPFAALNGGPQFKFDEAISFVVDCEDQAEIDYHWDKLGAGGDPEAQQCGWLKDKYGVSWQIVPKSFAKMMTSGETEKTRRAFAAMLHMKKIDIAAIQKAYDGEA